MEFSYISHDGGYWFAVAVTTSKKLFCYDETVKIMLKCTVTLEELAEVQEWITSTFFIVLRSDKKISGMRCTFVCILV